MTAAAAAGRATGNGCGRYTLPGLLDDRTAIDGPDADPVGPAVDVE